MTFTSGKCIVLDVILLSSWLVLHVSCAPNYSRISVMPDWSQYNHHKTSGSDTYAFGYDIEDPETNNVQFRSEERHSNGTITGSYGYLEPDGNIHMVHYIADGAGFRATVEDSSRTGMLKPIPVLNDKYTIAYGYSPEMLAAMKSKQIYKYQKILDQRTRPTDQENVGNEKTAHDESKTRFVPEENFQEAFANKVLATGNLYL